MDSRLAAAGSPVARFLNRIVVAATLSEDA